MKQKDLYYLVLSSFILTLLWVGFNIYDTIATTTISEALQVQIRPINPDFDPTTIQALKKRQQINPTFTFTPQGGATATTPTPTPRVATNAAALRTPTPVQPEETDNQLP